MNHRSNQSQKSIRDRIEAIERLIAKDKIRFSVCSPNGRHSGVWAAGGHKSDYYIGARSILGNVKISLHASRIGRVAMTEAQYGLLCARGLLAPGDDRAFIKWRRATTPEQGGVHVASLIFPINYLHLEAAVGSPKKPLFQFEAPHDAKQAVEFGFVYSREPIDVLEQKLMKTGKPLFRTGLDNGESVSVVVRLTNFDPAVLPSQDKLNNGGLRVLSAEDMPEPGGERSNLTAALWNKPEDGGTLQVIEVGGVTMRRRTKPIES